MAGKAEAGGGGAGVAEAMRGAISESGTDPRRDKGTAADQRDGRRKWWWWREPVASWGSSFCWSVCDYSPPNTPINSLIRLSICLPSTGFPLPASSSPLDPPSCFLPTRHYGLILAAQDRMDISTIM